MSENTKEAVFDCQNGSKRVSGIIFDDEYGFMPRMEKIAQIVGNLRLVGETGTGKTTGTYKLAENLNAELFEVVLTNNTTRWDLLGSDVLIGGKTEFREGIVLRWLKSAYSGFKILYVDGFNYAEANICALFESLADFRGNVYIPELNATFKRTDKHILVISYNPSEKNGYAGTVLENIATIRRFEGIVFKYISASKETKLIQRLTGNNYNWSRKFVEMANKTRLLYKDGKLRTPITTGNVLNYARLKKAGLSDDELIEIASSLFPEAERGIFMKCYEESEMGIKEENEA